uniref:Uncharacterized protein n=1 Tax=Setaria viridis TaxID=4556 RepID=A0A4V6Y8L5_SETVI|nr:hypothetical protein SEVIR_3G044100v2 [Setaria viridis]
MEQATALLEQVPGFWRDFLLGMLKPVAATAVVAVAVALSFSQRLGLEREMLFAVARVFLQLSVVGFVLQFIFSQENALWILLAYLFMVEAALALGATPRQATLQQVRRSLGIALSPVIDAIKTVGLITLPGTMTGLILGGASPLEAIQLQIVVTNMLMAANTVSSIVSSYLCWTSFFTKEFQLKDEVFAEK